MADLLHSNLSISFVFSSLSLPLNHSPPHHFSLIRFSPLINRRFSHSSSLLAKLSSSPSQFDIVSRTENLDGSVNFKFGDVTEISPTVDGGHEVDLVRDDDGSLDDQSDVVADVENSSDSVGDDAVDSGSTSTAEVENSIDYVEDDVVKNGSTSIAEDDAGKSDLNANASIEVENLGGTAEVELKTNLTVTAEVENSSDSVEEELECVSFPIAEMENSNDSVKEELDSESITIVEVASLSDSVEEELDSDSISIPEVANSSDIDTAKYENQIVDNVVPACDSSVSVMVGQSDELREASEVMSDDGKLEHDNESSSAGKTRFDVMIENAGELSEKSAQMSVDGAGGVSSMITEISHSVEERVVEDVNDTVMSEQSEAEQFLEKEKEDMVGLMSKQLEAEPVIDQEDEDTTELMSKQLEAEPIINKNGESSSVSSDVVLGSNKVALAGNSIAKLDEQLTQDTSDAARPGVEASRITSAETTSDSLNMRDMSSLAASAPLSFEVNDVSPPTISQSRDDQHCCDMSPEAGPGSEPWGLASSNISLDSRESSDTAKSVTPLVSSSTAISEVQDFITYTSARNDDEYNDTLVAAHPATSGITLAENNLESLNKEESLAPTMSISSAVASLSHSIEALTGGKDASFVSNNWFGVADGVGQWSFGGIDVGLYAHEFMQSCEKLLKSESAGLTNVKKLLQQSAAMTQSTGSARVLIAHVADEVLHVANIGDSGFLIIRNGTIFRKSSPMVHEFSFPYAIGLGDDSVEDVEEYHIDLEEGDVIITATDGLFDNLYEQEIATIVSKSKEAGMHLQDLAELLASKAQEVGRSESARSPFADAAQAAGHPEFIGGKFDHVTVIVSLVQR